MITKLISEKIYIYTKNTQGKSSEQRPTGRLINTLQAAHHH